MTTLDQVLDVSALAALLGEGYLKAQRHPADDGLAIYNYTEKAQYERRWTPETRACRGLIVRLADSEVLARPFRKFHNTGELTDDELAPFTTEPVEVWDKLDGSLAILYPAPDGKPAIATRGSFASEQAVHATALLRRKYPDYAPPAGVTPLFEIIYPANRIVVDYGGQDDLVLLGGVHIASGASVPFDELARGWPGPAAKRFPYASLAEALAAPELPNTEGFVLRAVESDVRVKVKTGAYLRLHRLLTGVTVRVIWEHAGVTALAASGLAPRRIAQQLGIDAARVTSVLAIAQDGDWTQPYLEAVPEEFQLWVKRTVAAVHQAADEWEAARRATFAELAVAGLDRRAAAAAITALPDRTAQGAMFALLDGREIRSAAWRATRPAHELPFADQSEDEA